MDKKNRQPVLEDVGTCPTPPCAWVLAKGYFKTVYVCEKCGDKIVT